MNLLLLTILSIVAIVLAYKLDKANTAIAGEQTARRLAQRRAEDAYERLHAVSNSALRGHPMVKWAHPHPEPASDHWYWRARFEGREFLFTEEAVRTARQRAALLLPAAGPVDPPVAKARPDFLEDGPDDQGHRQRDPGDPHHSRNVNPTITSMPPSNPPKPKPSTPIPVEPRPKLF